METALVVVQVLFKEFQGEVEDRQPEDNPRHHLHNRIGRDKDQ